MKVTRMRKLNCHQLDENSGKNYWLELVVRDISMDETVELENERVERILSNDYLIIENVLYGISGRNNNRTNRQKYLTRDD